jgi:uncharacterized protein YwgA
MMDKTSKLFASLSALGINPKMETFVERKKVQKIVYLLDKVFKMDFGFSYNWYLHGPYSPEVTRIVFDVVEGRQNVTLESTSLTGEDQHKINSLKTFLGEADLNSTDKLELLVSVHYLLDCYRQSKTKKADVVAFLKEKKPYFSTEQVCKAIDRLYSILGQ